METLTRGVVIKYYHASLSIWFTITSSTYSTQKECCLGTAWKDGPIAAVVASILLQLPTTFRLDLRTRWSLYLVPFVN